MNFTNVMNALSGAVSIWETLTSLKPLYYIIIIGVLLVIAVALLVFAIAKKARVRHNDVNVLLMLGDNEDSVDTSIFKKHYAMVLISKTDNATVAEPKQLQPLVQLSDNEEEIIQEDTVADEEIIEPANDEEIITDDLICDEFAEDAQAEENEIVASDDVVTDEFYSDEMAVANAEEEIPFAETVETVEEAAIDELAAEDEQEPIVDEVTEETLDEEAAATEFVVEEFDADNNVEEVADIEENAVTKDEFEDANVEIFDNLNIATPIIIAPPVTEKVVEKENVSLYDIDNSENGDGDRIEVVTYIRDNGVCKGVSELIEEEATDADVEGNEEPISESEPEIIEEVMHIVVEDTSSNNAVEEIQEESLVKEIVNDVNEEAAEEVVEEQITEEEQTESITEEVVEELPAVEDEVAAATAEAVVEIEENESAVTELLLHEVQSKNEEELAYTLVNVESAVPEAIEAAENGELIVDANGDGVAEEVLVDKNILKSRYKTVDLETRLRRTEESVKGFYSEIKNFLLSYTGVKSRVSKKFDTFTIGRFIVAKMALRGNVINLYLALASESVEDKYFAEDVGNSETYGKTPTLHKVKSKRGCKYGIELIRDIMSELQIAVNEKYIATDYVAMYPPENIEEKKDEIRHLFKDSISVEDLGVMTDEESLEFIEIVKNKEYTINKFLPINKYVIFVDDLDMLYDSGDTVTINDLINKEALPKEENIFLEIRARGTLTRQLTVEAHSFDPNAIKMIILTDGKVIQYK